MEASTPAVMIAAGVLHDAPFGFTTMTLIARVQVACRITRSFSRSATSPASGAGRPRPSLVRNAFHALEVASCSAGARNGSRSVPTPPTPTGSGSLTRPGATGAGSAGRSSYRARRCAPANTSVFNSVMA